MRDGRLIDAYGHLVFRHPAGLAVGVAGAALSGPLLAALLFEVRSTDASVFAAAGVTLAATGILANYLPARRAGRVDPITALRTE